MHKLILFAAMTAAVTLGAVNTAPAAHRTSGGVPAGWAPADCGDSLWRDGRDAISDEEWRHAAQDFARIIERCPKSTYVADSHYWQAFALGRQGGSENVRTAVSLLQKEIEKFASAASVKNGDAKSLMTRLQGARARGGDADAAAEISSRASASAGAGSARRSSAVSG